MGRLGQMLLPKKKKFDQAIEPAIGVRESLIFSADTTTNAGDGDRSAGDRETYWKADPVHSVGYGGVRERQAVAERQEGEGNETTSRLNGNSKDIKPGQGRKKERNSNPTRRYAVGRDSVGLGKRRKSTCRR